MARPPKPTAQKIAEGNRGKRRLNTAGEIVPDALADLSPPAWLSETAKQVWRDEAPQLARVRLLTEAGKKLFAMGCQEMGHYIDLQKQIQAEAEANGGKIPYMVDGKNGNKIMNQAFATAAMFGKRAQAILREFGMSPLGLRQLQIEPQTSIFDLFEPSEQAAKSNGKAPAEADYYH